MKKYKIHLSGKGSEVLVYSINGEQKQKLKEFDFDSSEIDFGNLSPILGVEFIHDSDISYTGPYSEPTDYFIEVKDEDGNLVWQSDDNFYPDDVNFNCVHDNEDVLLIEDYSKGEFYTFDLEIDEDFDFNKLYLKITEIGDMVEVITGLFYDSKDLDDSKEFSDIWSKGLYFHLCELPM
jgi:hypothetical protein